MPNKQLLGKFENKSAEVRRKFVVMQESQTQEVN